MKKVILSTMLLISANSFSIEGSIRAGFDFYRSSQLGKEITDYIPIMNLVNEYDKGFTIGAEIIPYTNKYVDLGAGFEYNFGTKTLMLHEINKVVPQDDEKPKEVYQIPVYTVAKVNAFDFGNKKGAIYVPLRLGYSISNNPSYNGLYYGAGVGYENGPFLVEATYNGTYSSHCKLPNHINGGGGSGGGAGKSALPKIAEMEEHYGAYIDLKCFTHRAGVRLGYKFGEKKTKKETTNGKTINIIVSPVVAPEISPEINPKVSTDVNKENKR